MKKTIALLLAVVLSLLFASCKTAVLPASNIAATTTKPNKTAAVASKKADLAKPSVSVKNQAANDESTTAAKPLKRITLPVSDGEIAAANYRCYSLFSARMKMLYTAMVKGFLSLESEIETTGFVANEVHIVYEAICTDYPQIFWIPNNYQLIDYGKKTSAKFEYSSTYDEINKQLLQLNTLAQKIVSAVPKNADSYQKELFLHDYICKNTAYNDNQTSKSDYTAYGALINKLAVCEGYSRAMQLLLYKAGIEASLVRGSNGGEGHMWNIVKINGEWYHLDVTFNDSNSGIFHTYFNLTDYMILFDHEIDGIIKASALNFGAETDYNIELPDCYESFENYFVKNGLIIDNTDDFQKVLFAGLDKIELKKGNKVEFSFGEKVNLVFEDIEKLLHSMLAKYRDKNGKQISLYSAQHIVGSKGFMIIIQ